MIMINLKSKWKWLWLWSSNSMIITRLDLLTHSDSYS